MSSVNSNLHNLRSVLIGPTSRFIFANGALTRAQAQAMGAEDFGNLKAHQLQVENTTEPVLTSVDGITQQIDEQSRLLAIGYQLTSREQAVRDQIFALLGQEGTAFTQASASTADGTVLAFGTTAAKINAWYELQIAGVAVRNVSVVTIATKTEGTDFVVHKELGLIRFLTAQSADLTPVITCPEVNAASAAYMRRIDPIKQSVFRGFGTLVCMDRDQDNKVIFDHRWFKCTLKFDSQPNRDSEAGAGESVFKIMIMEEPGIVWARA